MTATFYKTTDDNRKVNKHLTTVKNNVSLQIWQTCPILNPSILVEYDADLLDANYMYVNAWGRYYFIDNITIVEGGRLMINGTVDVLKTYMSEILALNCTIVRTAKNGKANLYLDDGKFKVLNYPRIQTKRFPNSLNKNLEYVLTIAGGS